MSGVKNKKNKFFDCRPDKTKKVQYVGLPKDELTINIDSLNRIKVTRDTDNGKESTFVKLDELIKVFVDSKQQIQQKNTNIKKSGYVQSLGVLPNSKLISTIEYKRTENNKEVVLVMMREPTRSKIKYYEDTFKDVGIPRLLFAVKLYDNKIQRCNVAAIKDVVITPNTKLYMYPFSNVFHDTSICYGANRVYNVNIDEMHQLTRIPNMFIEMTNNDHNYSGQNLSGLEFRKLLKQLSGKDFPMEYLKEVTNSGNEVMLYKEWFKRLS